MKHYIATFYSHFGAIRFRKSCEAKGLSGTVMPVPRTLSSSCGTCVRFRAAGEEDFPEKNEEIEQIVQETEEGYRVVFQADEFL